MPHRHSLPQRQRGADNAWDMCRLPGLLLQLSRIELPVAEIEQRVFGRERTADEAILGVHIGSYSVRAKDPDIVAHAQRWWSVSALMLYALEKKIIDYALVSGFTSREPWKPAPKVARTRQELIDNAGSEYLTWWQIGGWLRLPFRIDQLLSRASYLRGGLPGFARCEA